jgi:pimeloyl-ACP methyl ester carboxylesterase
LPAVGVTEHEVDVLRSLPPAWERLREGVPLVPRESRALDEAAALLPTIEPPDVPTLYLHGEHTEFPLYPTLDEVARLLPTARFHCLAGQRHLAHAFDPGAFVQAVLDFTATVDGEPDRGRAESG